MSAVKQECSSVLRVLRSACGVVLVGLMIGSGPAFAVQNPPGCNANNLTLDLQRDKINTFPGDIVNYTVTVSNPAAGGASCDTVGNAVVLTCPGPTGNPDGPATTLASGVDYPAGTLPISFPPVPCTMPNFTGAVVASATVSGGLLDNPNVASTPFTITKAITVNVAPVPTLTLVKTWVNAISGDAITVTTTGLQNNATVSSISTGNNTTTGSPVANAAGPLVTLPAETFGPGSQANYTTTVACVGAVASSATPPATFTMPDANVTCTYTNTRNQPPPPPPPNIPTLSDWMYVLLGLLLLATGSRRVSRRR